MERNEIVEKSFRLFRNYGMKRITMDDIALDLGISKKTLYTHFNHKEELLIECVKSVTIEWENQITSIKSAELHPVLCIVKILRFAFLKLTSYKISWFQDIKRNYEINKEVEAYRRQLRVKHLAPLYREAIEKGYFNSSITLDSVDIACDILFLHMDEFVSGNLDIDRASSFDELFNHIVLFGLKGSLSKANEDLLDNYIELSHR